MVAPLLRRRVAGVLRKRMTNHDYFATTFRGKEGEILSTEEVRRILSERYPQFPLRNFLPNDHGNGNDDPHDCWCVKTEHQVFEHVGFGKYRVRHFK